jgi:hypothetical protein
MVEAVSQLVILGLWPQVAQPLKWEGNQWRTGCNIIIIMVLIVWSM